MIWHACVGRSRSLLSYSSATKRSRKERCVTGFSTTRTYLMSWWKLIRRGVYLGTDIPTRARPMRSPLPSPLPSRVSYENACWCSPRQVTFLEEVAGLSTGHSGHHRRRPQSSPARAWQNKELPERVVCSWRSHATCRRGGVRNVSIDRRKIFQLKELRV